MTAGHETIELASGDARATASPLGAELKSWRAGGLDLLWPGDAAWWAQSAPILFPIVGWARDGRIKVDGIARPMGVHGFAAGSAFSLVKQAPDAVRFVLRDDAASRAIYPFAFELEIAYRLASQAIHSEFVVRNTGTRTMPFALGFHPGFRWPFTGAERDGHAIVFEQAEAPHVPVIAPGGLFSTERRAIPIDGNRLELTDELVATEALCFLDARSRSLQFEAPDGTSITMTTQGFRHLAVWSKAGAPFVSLEAWTGHGDPVGFAGELRDRPSMLLLEPGSSQTFAVELSFAG